jgi:hypothetical protein
MELRDVQDVVEVPEVEVLRHSGLGLLCRIGTIRASRTVAVPRLQMRLGTTVRHPGDRGRLVILQSLAQELGLAGPASSVNP